MEPEVVGSGGRGRKRRRKDAQTSSAHGPTKKQVVGKALVGMYVKKEFKGSGVFLGKIVSYESGLYRVEYEDGDSEDLDKEEVREFLIGNSAFDEDLVQRKEKLDELTGTKGVKVKENKAVKVKKAVKAKKVDREKDVKIVEASSIGEPSNSGGANTDALQVDADSSSESDGHDQDIGGFVAAPVVAPPQFPPSSGNIGVPEQYVSHLLSVYSFVRSFSIRLFLSPFGLDDFVGALNCPSANTLLDSIHVAVMRVLRRHLEALSSDGSSLATKCLRFADWSLLDTLTWPFFVVQYLMVMGYSERDEWKGFYINALEKEYYTVSAGRKLIILQILCDDILQSEELRAEIDMREESEVGIDSDAVATLAEGGPRRGHHRYSKTFAYKNESTTETHETKSYSDSSSLAPKGIEKDADAAHDGNGDECCLCGMDGTLFCCDGCPSAYHSRCIGISKVAIPEGQWYCPECKINKIGPPVTKGTCLRGAEVLGIDPYGHVFLATCSYLLVMNASVNAEPCLRYYSQNDISKLLETLHSSAQLTSIYSEICKGIAQYWDLCIDAFVHVEATEIAKTSAGNEEDAECSTLPPTHLDEHCQPLTDMVEGEQLASGVTQTTNFGDQTKCDSTSQQNCGYQHNEISEHINLGSAKSSGSVCQNGEPSDLSNHRSGSIKLATSTSVDSNVVHGSIVNRDGRGYQVNGYSYMGSHFKSNAYVNTYVHGDFAASAAANLAVLSSEESHVSESHTTENQKIIMNATISLQAKAFSLASTRFFWPNFERKFIDVRRERCGWCYSCQAVSSKKGCMLTAAASNATNAIKGSMKILSSFRPFKGADETFSSIALYVILMEESLCGLTVGPFRNEMYRKEWRKRVEQATTCIVVKSLLLELEQNIRIVALSEDWIKLVDRCSDESSLTKTAVNTAGSTLKRGPGRRRGRKPSVISEVPSDDCLEENSSDINWWRGGLLSKLICQRGVLPHSLVKKAAREGGRRKIPGIYYSEGSEMPKRSRQFIWRAVVEMSKNTSQLALQIRYLDHHVRWNDLVRPEKSVQDGKGQETEASAFRNAFVCDKRIVESKVAYGVSFGKQKHLPSRVMKSIIEVEQQDDGNEKYWFAENRIPLYLIKEYEEKVGKVLHPLTNKPPSVLSVLQRKQLKASRNDIFGYLSRKRDKLDSCCCASCQQEVLLGDAVKCSKCEGFCHKDCTRKSTIQRNPTAELHVTCKKCNPVSILPQLGNNYKSPTIPLLVQRQVFPSAVTTIDKGEKQKSTIQTPKSIGHRQSSLESQPDLQDSDVSNKNRRKLCNWGLIWKKKDKNEREEEEKGVDFRLKHLLQRGNTDMKWLASPPSCHLCQKQYNSGLMFIRCDTCNNWYHAEAVELQESQISQLVGFKCCRCRRIRSPVCPYLDEKTKMELERKIPRRRFPKAAKSTAAVAVTADHNNKTIPQMSKARESTIPLLQKKEEVPRPPVNPVPVPVPVPIPTVEEITENNNNGFEDIVWNGSGISGAGPQKLPVRRQVKSDDKKEAGASKIPTYQVGSSDPLVQINPFNEQESFPLDWDVSGDGIEDDMMFDYEEANFEPNNFEANSQDMEFEPQTYFSFNELLSSDDGQLGEVDAASGNWEDPSLISQNGLIEQYEIEEGIINNDNPSGVWENSTLISQNGLIEQYEIEEGINNNPQEVDASGGWENSTLISQNGLMEQYEIEEGIINNGNPQEEVDASGGGWGNSTLIPQNGLMEQYEIEEGMNNNNQQEEEEVVCIVPCQFCTRTEPLPDLSCPVCGVHVHSYCSPWSEYLSSEGIWLCGRCRDWC